VVVSLALVSHHHFNVRNSDRWLCDQRDVVRNAHGGRTIGALPCSTARARGGVRGRAASGNAAASSSGGSDIAIGAECVGRLGDLLEDAQPSLIPVEVKYLVHIHEEVSKRRRDSSVTVWLNIIYGHLERCAHCVVSPRRGVERNISMDANFAELVSVAESGYRDVVPLRQTIDLQSPLPDGFANGYENPGQNGDFTEHKSSRVRTVLDTVIQPEPSPSAGKRPSISEAAEAVKDIRPLSRDIASAVRLSLRILRSRASATVSQSSDESRSGTGMLS
jgi:hypothetical protein